MSDVIAPGNEVTFTITKAPRRIRDQKTLLRLMRMQPHIQKGLKMLQRRRALQDNDPRRRAGLIWVHRKRATKLARVERGASFTLRVTPHIIPDIKSVDRFLEAKSA